MSAGKIEKNNLITCRSCVLIYVGTALAIHIWDYWVTKWQMPDQTRILEQMKPGIEGPILRCRYRLVRIGTGHCSIFLEICNKDIFQGHILSAYASQVCIPDAYLRQ